MHKNNPITILIRKRIAQRRAYKNLIKIWEREVGNNSEFLNKKIGKINWDSGNSWKTCFWERTIETKVSLKITKIDKSMVIPSRSLGIRKEKAENKTLRRKAFINQGQIKIIHWSLPRPEIKQQPQVKDSLTKKIA